MGKKLSLIVLVLAIAALCAFVATPALGAVHVTTVSVSSPTMSSLSLESTGDAGASHGNRNDGTSPIAPGVDADVFEWFNQNVRAFDPVLVDPDGDTDVVLTGGFWQLSTNGTTYGVASPLFRTGDNPIASAEGLYSVTATGTDEDQVAAVVATVTPAFGIDKTKPVASSDRVPVYLTPATVTFTGTDALSGPENAQFSIDNGPFDWSYDAVPLSPFTVPLSFTAAGTHTVAWHLFDNAGNINSGSTSFIVRPVGFVPTVKLAATPGTGTEHRRHIIKFSGTVSAMYASMPLTITVQRRVSGVWKSYPKGTISTTVAAYASAFSHSKTITPDGTFRARAVFDGGVSTWHTFHVL